MLIVTGIETISAVLSGAVATNNPSYYACYRVMADDLSTFTPTRSIGSMSGTTSINLVSGGSATDSLVVDHISVYNRDTANVTVTVSHGSTVVRVVVLTPGETLEFNEGSGWKVLAVNGSIKTTSAQGLSPVTSEVQMTVLGADVVNNNATANTMADVTGLNFPVLSGQRYKFRFVAVYTSAATTTGSRWSVTGPAFTSLAATSSYSLTTTSNTINTIVAYDMPAASNASSATTTGNIAIIEGFIVPSADGNLQMRFASEIASSAITAKVGSYVEWQQI